ncbi:MAG: redoxin domain-containing protein [Candidatus Aminicenantes bacterium]|nr:redoxin domain-containing protein [Candidatus Aminicenantes bacterium]
MRKIISLTAAAFVVIAVLVATNSVTIQGSEFSKAPDFILKDLDGNEVTLDDFKGDVLFINFWATWCPPCREEIPGFVEMYEKYNEDGLEILGVSLDRKGPEVVRKFAEKYEINYPMVMGTNQLIQDYQPGQYIPSTIIIDPQGTIRDRHVGFLDKATLEKYFLDLSQ